MKKFPPLPIIDMLHLHKQSPIEPVLGRGETIARLVRTIARQPYNNMLLIGKRGVGKSSVVQGLAQDISMQVFSASPSLPYLQLQTFIVAAQHTHSPIEARLTYLGHAFHSLPPCVFVIDDAERFLHLLPNGQAFDQVFSAFSSTVSRRLMLVLEEERLGEWREKFSGSLKTFDTIPVPEPKNSICQDILSQRVSRTAQTHHILVDPLALPAIYEGSQKVSSDRAQPDRAIRLLDEICAAAAVTNSKKVTQHTVDVLIRERLGLPAISHASKVHHLPRALGDEVIGQGAATQLVASVIQRGLLGLKNRERPIGSFLFLGPSGVGKTELARVLAQKVFGSHASLIRLDMSEFSDSHTVARLIGAPPGYVGHEAGGQLTEPVKAKPFSLVLLDEIEKAHPSIFDIFLQVLDDGRLTDGQGQTVDFSQTIILATSNIGIQDIVTHFRKQADVTSPQFLQSTLMPLLRQRFRIEFLNRFEGIVVFKPFTMSDLLAIARLEIKKIEKRLAHHHIKVDVSDSELRQMIGQVSDPHVGARPLKRFIEKRCEEAVAKTLLPA